MARDNPDDKELHDMIDAMNDSTEWPEEDEDDG